MKRILALSLSLAMMLMLVACGGGNSENTSSSEEGSSYEDVIDPDDIGGSTDETQEDAAGTEDTESTEEENEQQTSSSNKAETSKPTENKPAENKPAETAKPAASKNYSGSLSDLVSGIYAKQPVELALGDPMAIDLSDTDALNYYTGLTDASKLKEAYFSESMIGSQAYSLVVVRVNNASDAASVAQSMYDGIDQVKWLCVTADALAVGAYGDTVMLAMVDSNMGATLHTDLRAAYAAVVGADKLDTSLDRVDPNATPKNALAAE